MCYFFFVWIAFSAESYPVTPPVYPEEIEVALFYCIINGCSILKIP
jgi:hypothetical protein